MTYGIIRDHAKSYPNPDACRPLLLPWPLLPGLWNLSLSPHQYSQIPQRYSLDSQLPAHYALLEVNSVLHLPKARILY
jgi:hypothetical protein